MAAFKRRWRAAAVIFAAVLAAGCAASEPQAGGTETSAETLAAPQAPIQIHGAGTETEKKTEPITAQSQETAAPAFKPETQAPWETAALSSEPEPSEAPPQTEAASVLSSANVYVTGHPVLSSALFLDCSLSTMEAVEDPMAQTVSRESIFDGNFMYSQGAGITYVTHTSLNGALYGIILPEDQFLLGCGLRVGMGEEELSALSLPFEKCSREDYPMDSLYLTDPGCPLNTVEFDSAYVFSMGELPQELHPDSPLFSGGRLSVTALVKEGRVVSVFTDIPVAG